MASSIGTSPGRRRGRLQQPDRPLADSIGVGGDFTCVHGDWSKDLKGMTGIDDAMVRGRWNALGGGSPPTRSPLAVSAVGGEAAVSADRRWTHGSQRRLTNLAATSGRPERRHRSGWRSSTCPGRRSAGRRSRSDCWARSRGRRHEVELAYLTRLAAEVGAALYDLVSEHRSTALGDWLFARAAFQDDAPPAAAFLEDQGAVVGELLGRLRSEIELPGYRPSIGMAPKRSSGARSHAMTGAASRSSG